MRRTSSTVRVARTKPQASIRPECLPCSVGGVRVSAGVWTGVGHHCFLGWGPGVRRASCFGGLGFAGYVRARRVLRAGWAGLKHTDARA